MTPVMEREQLLRIMSVQFGKRRPTCCEVNEVLVNMLEQMVEAWCRHLTVNEGMSAAQVEQQLQHNIPQVEQWRLDTLEWVLDQYDTNSHTRH